MGRISCIRNAAVATLDSQDRVFDPGEVWIRDGRVVAVGPVGQTTPPVGEPVDLIEAPNRIVIPGLVNAHAHSYAALLKGTIDALPLDLYMLQVIAGGSFREPRHVYVSALVSCLDMLRTGTTAVIDHFSHRPAQTIEAIDAVCQAYQDVGIRAAVAPMFADRRYMESVPLRREIVPPDLLAEWQRVPIPDPVAYFEVLATALAKWQGRAQLQLLLGVDGPQRCSRRLLEMTGEFAERHRLGLHTHLLETKTQALMAPPEAAGSAVAYLDQFGLINPRSSLVHFNWCTERDMELALERGVTVVHVPTSGLGLGSGIQPAIRLLRRSVPVALGSDGANCGTLSMFEKAKMAALLSRVTDVDYERWITARDALRMATAHGARALGMANELGFLAPGARADLVILDARKAHYHPRGDLWNHLVYYETGAGVETVFVEGEAVVRDGRLTRIDEEAILAEADALSARLRRENQAAFAAIERQRPVFRQMILEALAQPHPAERLALLR